MKVTFIGHASILVEAVDGRPIDHIYVSHGHHDHFHPGTVATLPRTAKVLVSTATCASRSSARTGSGR